MVCLGVLLIVGFDLDCLVFILFKYDDVMVVMWDVSNYISGFIVEGLGVFFDGLIFMVMDGDVYKSMCILLQLVFMFEMVNCWKEIKIDWVICEEYL